MVSVRPLSLLNIAESSRAQLSDVWTLRTNEHLAYTPARHHYSRVVTTPPLKGEKERRVRVGALRKTRERGRERRKYVLSHLADRARRAWSRLVVWLVWTLRRLFARHYDQKEKQPTDIVVATYCGPFTSPCRNRKNCAYEKPPPPPPCCACCCAAALTT